ncbi:MAG: ABC transporter ATP-binding protein [Clostridia bacterium]|nr:ABC transporter ATP-binding protein [Clostridia bacterium]
MNETAISIKNLSVSYGKCDAIQNISLDIKRGEFVSVIGPNGAGKTTLLHTVLGFIKQYSGEVKVLGKNIKKVYKHIGFVPQTETCEKNFPITVEKAVLTATLGPKIIPFKYFSKNDCDKASKLLENVGLKGFEKRAVGELSGGEFQRMLIARALAQNPEILFLDEPTANIDTESSDKIFSLLSELNKNGVTIVLVTHDLISAKKYSTKIINL